MTKRLSKASSKSSGSIVSAVESQSLPSPSSLTMLPIQDENNSNSSSSMLATRQGSQLALLSSSSKEAFSVAASSLTVSFRGKNMTRTTPQGQLSLALRWVMTNSAASDLAGACLLDTTRWTIVRSTVTAAASLASWLSLSCFIYGVVTHLLWFLVP